LEKEAETLLDSVTEAVPETVLLCEAMLAVCETDMDTVKLGVREMETDADME
jgi:hypothetical protein